MGTAISPAPCLQTAKRAAMREHTMNMLNLRKDKAGTISHYCIMCVCKGRHDTVVIQSELRARGRVCTWDLTLFSCSKTPVSRDPGSRSFDKWSINERRGLTTDVNGRRAVSYSEWRRGFRRYRSVCDVSKANSDKSDSLNGMIGSLYTSHNLLKLYLYIATTTWYDKGIGWWKIWWFRQSIVWLAWHA